jgi:putative membrane protein
MVRERFRTVRLAALVAGIAVLWVVVGSPLSTLDHALLTFHMVQHLLLMTVTAPLILWGGSGDTIRNSVPIWLARRVADRVPIVFCWIAGTLVVVAWHVPAAHQLGMSSPSWHSIQHASFLAGGLLFWWPVIGSGTSSDPSSRVFIPLYLFLATLPCDALSAFLAFCGRVVYPLHHHAGKGLFGLSPLQDQECAGALMWFWVTIAYLIPAFVVTVRVLSPPPARAGT